MDSVDTHTQALFSLLISSFGALFKRWPASDYAETTEQRPTFEVQSKHNWGASIPYIHRLTVWGVVQKKNPLQKTYCKHRKWGKLMETNVPLLSKSIFTQKPVNPRTYATRLKRFPHKPLAVNKNHLDAAKKKNRFCRRLASKSFIKQSTTFRCSWFFLFFCAAATELRFYGYTAILSWVNLKSRVLMTIRL